jgi:hypothetical protein
MFCISGLLLLWLMLETLVCPIIRMLTAQTILTFTAPDNAATIIVKQKFGTVIGAGEIRIQQLFQYLRLNIYP